MRYTIGFKGFDTSQPDSGNESDSIVNGTSSPVAVADFPLRVCVILVEPKVTGRTSAAGRAARATP